MDERLKNASFEEIFEDISLYNSMIKALKAAGFKTLCNCGKSQKITNINIFLNNKLNTLNYMEKIKNRTITPKFKGVIFSSRAMKHFNSATLSDDAILNIIKNGWLSKDFFDFSKYKAPSEEEAVSDSADEEVVPEHSKDIVEEAEEEEAVSEPSNEKPDNLYDIILDMYNSGLKPKEIAEKLNSDGFVYKEGKTFNSSSVSSIIKKRK